MKRARSPFAHILVALSAARPGVALGEEAAALWPPPPTEARVEARSTPGARIDRWGRPVAAVDDDWALDALASGEAALAPSLAPSFERDARRANRSAALREAEARAIEAGLGLWRDGGVVRTAERSGERIGAFGVIDGSVVDVAKGRAWVYVNFGEDWRTDFTVRVDKGIARDWSEAGFDLTALKGARLRVRGFVFEADGPMIEAISPLQFELEPFEVEQIEVKP